MSMPTDNNISVKEYNKTNKYEDLGNRNWKNRHLKNTTVNVGALDRIKKVTHKYIINITSSPIVQEI